jgi:hypothetical protein
MMKPPWKQFPQIQYGSIGWRMGPGEDYWDEFDRWYKRKNPDHRKRYREENPEPDGWEGFYDLKEKHLTSWKDMNKQK